VLKHLPVIVAFLLLLNGAHAAALDQLRNTEGKAGDADGAKNDVALFINGTMFDDSNGNGKFDDSDPGISGRVIRLVLDGREISNTTTDESGRYSFTNLVPGNYTVVEDQEAGWKTCAPSKGYYTIDLINESVDNVDFGIARVPGTSNTRVSKTPDAQAPETCDGKGCDGKGITLIQVGEEQYPFLNYHWWEEEKKAAAIAPEAYIPLD
jgi:hypothetical protein